MHTRSGLSQRADRKSNIIGIREQGGGLTERYRSAMSDAPRARDCAQSPMRGSWRLENAS